MYYIKLSNRPTQHNTKYSNTYHVLHVIMFIMYYVMYIHHVICMSTLHNDLIIFCTIFALLFPLFIYYLVVVIYQLWYGCCEIQIVYL